MPASGRTQICSAHTHFDEPRLLQSTGAHTEGFDTLDLKEAKALLDELAS
jgi:hypothetical protein